MPVIDYDKVREKNQELLQVITVECRKVNKELSEHIKECEDSINELRLVREGHADLDNRLGLMNKSIQAMEQNLEYLNISKEKWESAEGHAIKIAKSIEKLEAEQEKKSKEKKKKVYFPTDPSTMKNEQLLQNGMINPLFMRREKTEEINCEGFEGYEEEKLGDGLTGDYYDNETWIGTSIQRTDPQIHFIWTSSPPINGVNSHNFSIRWSGYIKAPFTGNFFFHVTTTDSAMLSINNKIILAHNMQTSVNESKNRNDIWLDNEVKKALAPNVNYIDSKSKQIQLIGGNKYK